MFTYQVFYVDPDENKNREVFLNEYPSFKGDCCEFVDKEGNEGYFFKSDVKLVVERLGNSVVSFETFDK